MSFTSKVTIEDGPDYQVVSYGNGAAYALVRKSDDASTFIQGDAASEFRKEWQETEASFSRACSMSDDFKTAWPSVLADFFDTYLPEEVHP